MMLQSNLSIIFFLCLICFINFQCTVHTLSDDSGYYVSGRDAGNRASFCKYLYSSQSNTKCQQLTNFYSYAYGQLKLSDSSFFMLSNDPIAPYPLHFYSFIFNQTSPTWSASMSSPSSIFATSTSSSLLSSSSIYCFFTYGSTKYVYFAVFSSSNGSVTSSRYKSSISCINVYGSAKNGDYIIATVYCSANYLVVLNIASYSFDVRLFTDYVYGCSIDNSGRFVTGGDTNIYGYITKFMAQAISAHPDFQASSAWSMTILSQGTEDIISDSGQTIGSVSESSTVSATVPPYTNLTLVYTLFTSFTSDVNYQTNDQTFSVVEGSTVQKSPDLPCSASGSTSISFSISNYITTAPSWVSIDSSLGTLAIVAPEVNSDTEYDFYINSVISGVTVSVKKLIKLTILNCAASDCQKCSSSNSTTCETCKSGFSLSSGKCSVPNSASDTKTILSIVVIAIVIATAVCIILSSLMNSSSIATRPLIFLLLLLTRAYIPYDIQAIIIGTDFVSNIYEYANLRKIEIYPSMLKSFEFSLSNSSLNPFEIKYDGTLANSYSIIVFLILIAIFHLCICLIKWLLSKLNENHRQSKLIKGVNWVAQKCFNFMTFGYYIRNYLEISQFILISSFYEIYVFNTIGPQRIVSLIFAVSMILLYLFILGIINYLIFSFYEVENDKHNKLEEFFWCLQCNRISRFSVILLLLRRFIFVAILITVVSIPSRALIGIMMFFQFPYFAWTIFSRPYKTKKENVIEIINECYFTLFVIILMIFNTQDEWNSLKTNICVWVLASNSMVVFIIVLVDFIKELIKKIKNKCNKIPNERTNGTRIAPEPSIIPQRFMYPHQNKKNKKSSEVSSVISKNYKREESKYTIHESMSDIKITPSKNWN